MSKLHHRKLSRVFPAYHPRAGEPTYFVEKMWESIYLENPEWLQDKLELQSTFALAQSGIYTPKHHTIRAGHHVKPGDFIRLSVWSGKPYRSKQIVVAPDIEVVSTWDFCKDLLAGEFRMNGKEIAPEVLQQIANNDGLSIGDFTSWFNKPFTGQIICWSKTVNYDLPPVR